MKVRAIQKSLEKRPDQTLIELAKRTGIRVGELANLVHDLERKGLVETEGEPGERKYRWITNVTA